MSQIQRSKREHCPECDATRLSNYVLVRPGEDTAVFVECAECGAFVARYTLRAYTCEDPYRSYLRQMRSRNMSSGAATHEKAETFAGELWAGYRDVKKLTGEQEEARSVEDLLEETD